MRPQDSSQDDQAAGSSGFFRKGFGGVAAAAILFFVAILGGVGKMLRHNGGKLGRGDVVVRTGLAAHALNKHLNPVPEPAPYADILESLKKVPHLEVERVVPEVPPLNPLGLQDADMPGPPSDEKPAPDIEDKLSDEDLRKVYEQGFELVMVCNRSETEYRGRPNGELESVRTQDDTETIVAVNGLILDRMREPAKLPDTKRGEYSKCRVRFSDEGRAALSLRSAIAIEGNSGLLEYGGTYELELVSGTKEDFDAGKPVAFRYSTEGLRQLRQDHRRFVERDAAELLVSGLLSSPAFEAMVPRLRAEARFVDFPNADILATSEQCVIRDSGRTLLRIAITFSK